MTPAFENHFVDYPEGSPQALVRLGDWVGWHLIGKRRFALRPFEMKIAHPADEALLNLEAMFQTTKQGNALGMIASKNKEINGRIKGDTVRIDGWLGMSNYYWVFRGRVVADGEGSILQGGVGDSDSRRVFAAASNLVALIACIIAVAELAGITSSGFGRWGVAVILLVFAAVVQWTLFAQSHDVLKEGEVSWSGVAAELKNRLR